MRGERKCPRLRCPNCRPDTHHLLPQLYYDLNSAVQPAMTRQHHYLAWLGHQFYGASKFVSYANGKTASLMPSCITELLTTIHYTIAIQAWHVSYIGGSKILDLLRQKRSLRMFEHDPSEKHRMRERRSLRGFERL